MPIKVTCKCGRVMTLADKWAGKSIPCATCAAPLRVPPLNQPKKLVKAAPPPLPEVEVYDDVVEVLPAPPPIPKPAAERPSFPPQQKSHAHEPAAIDVVEVYDDVVEVELDPPPIPKTVAGPPSPRAPQNQDSPPPSQTPMLITEILDDEPDSVPSDSPPPAESPAAPEPAAESDLVPLPAEPIEDVADDDDEEVHEVENLEVLEYKDDWESCGLLENPAPRLDVPLDPTEVKRTLQREREEASAGYELQHDSLRRTHMGVTGLLGALRLDTDDIPCLAYGADHATLWAAAEEDLFFLDFDARASTTSDRRMHSASISSLSISADCHYALSGDEEGGLLLWDAVGKRPLRWLDGHRGEIKATAFSADGSLAASAGVGGAVRLWQVPSGKMIPLDQAQLEQRVNTVCFSPDGRLLLAIGDQGRSRLWNVIDGQVTAKLSPGPKNPGSAAFGKDGTSILASNAHRFQAYRWNVASGERRRCFKGVPVRASRVQKTTVTPDGNGLLAVVFNVEEAREHHADHSGGPSLVVALGLGPVGIIGQYAAREAAAGIANAAADIGSRPKTGYVLERWDVTHEKTVSVVPLGATCPTAMACSPDGHRVIVAHDDGFIGLLGA